MKANELRIGNVIIYKSIQMADGSEEPHQLHQIKVTPEYLLALEKDSSYFKPIPLTEEWLLKFGFVMYNKSYFDLPRKTRTNNSKIYFEYTKDLNGDWYILLNEDIRVYLEFVHQLQNLYFALTSEELTISNK